MSNCWMTQEEMEALDALCEEKVELPIEIAPVFYLPTNYQKWRDTRLDRRRRMAPPHRLIEKQAVTHTEVPYVEPPKPSEFDDDSSIFGRSLLSD